MVALWPRFPAGGIWCRLTDLNRYPFAYKATALPLELSRLIWLRTLAHEHQRVVQHALTQKPDWIAEMKKPRAINSGPSCFAAQFAFAPSI